MTEEIDKKIASLQKEKQLLEAQKTGITKEEFQAYVAVQYSGVTNMFNVGLVSELSDLSRNKIFSIMKNYDTLRKGYGVEEGEKDSHKIGIVNLKGF
ncbi:MAG: hypothetical protein E6L03_10440 [Thaumarchaeota archaeon]|nr:MAG: hypothetical protein E6L03_10440 [Nitrososphaerota archaeon]